MRGRGWKIEGMVRIRRWEGVLRVSTFTSVTGWSFQMSLPCTNPYNDFHEHSNTVTVSIQLPSTSRIVLNTMPHTPISQQQIIIIKINLNES